MIDFKEDTVKSDKATSLQKIEVTDYLKITG